MVPTLGEPCPWRVAAVGAKPLLFHPRALLRVPGMSQGAELQTHRAIPVGFPSWHPTLCVLNTVQAAHLEDT